MNLSARSHRIDPSVQIILLVTALLLRMGSAAFCAEASNQVTFADKYSVELPASWKLEQQDDVAKSIGIKLSATIPGEGTTLFSAHIVKGGKTAEVVMQEFIAKAQKQQDFKLLDEDEVSTKAGKKGRLAFFRHKVLAGLQTSSVVTVAFQMIPDEVVLLRFYSMYETGDDPLKKHQGAIEAVYSSLKTSASGTGDEGSWLTTPAEKSKGDSKVTGADDSKIAGTYISAKRSTDSIVLKADGTFSINQRGESQTGTYTHDGATIRFKFSDGDTDTGKLEKETLVDQSGGRWVKKP